MQHSPLRATPLLGGIMPCNLLYIVLPSLNITDGPQSSVGCYYFCCSIGLCLCNWMLLVLRDLKESKPFLCFKGRICIMGN